MTAAPLFSLFCATWWTGALAVLLGSAALAAAGSLFQRRHREDAAPPLSVIVPVRENSPELAPALASLFSQSYPDFEVIVSAVEEPSPAIENARAVAARYPGISASFITRDPRAAENPKINNLALPIAEARHDLIVVKDANIRLKPERLAEMASLLAGGTGLVASIPVGIEPRNFPAEIECAGMNGYVARFLLAASALGLGFGIGATMLFSRRDFERAGGIAHIARSIGEDHAIAKMLSGIGRKTILSGTVEQIIGRRRISDCWRRQLRWAVCRRCETPLVFHAELAASPLAAALAGAGGANMIGISASSVFLGTIAVWIAADMLLAALKGWPVSWRSPLASLCFIIGFPLLWLQARLASRISWGGASFPIHRPAKMPAFERKT